MGPYNAFYLDDSVIPIHYQNLYAIAFNSSRILIRYCSNSNTQNLAVFIIPTENCNQHAFYAMSKNIFKVTIETIKNDYNMQVCAFSPSFVSNINRIATFGYENKIDGNAQIFYGISEESLQSKSSPSTSKRHEQSMYDHVIKEIDDYINEKRKYKNIHDKISKYDKIFTRESYFYGLIQKLKNKNIYFRINDRLKKDYEEEEYFKSIYSKHQVLHGTKHQTNNTNTLSISPSPGFLVSLKISSESRRMNIVNSTYYITYSVNKPNVNAKLIFNREFDNKKNRKIADTSMLDKHVDFLLYYDNYKSKFIYDNDWTYKIDISYSANMWQMMKWIWVILIIIFIVITLLIIGCLCGFIRSDRLFCFRRKNSAHEFTEEYDINFGNNRSRGGNGCGIFNESHYDDDQLETICYSPNLDDTVTYQNYNKQNKRSNSDSIENNNIRSIDSDSLSYEYEYEYIDEESIDNSNENYRKKRKKKQKVKKNSIKHPESPYQLDINNCADINDIFLDNSINSASKNIDNRNGDLCSAKNSDESLNPYGLPYQPSFLPNNNDENTDDSQHSFLF